jgi:phosphoadenosine phosphosulfate reductase
MDRQKMPLEEIRLYQLHARSAAYQRRLRQAHEIVRKALEQARRPMVACSWGKDSTVTLHLVWSQKPDIEVIFCDRSTEGGGELPETYEIIEKWKRRYNLTVHRAIPEITLIDILKSMNGFGDGDMQRTKSLVRREITIGPADRLREELGGDALFLGLRAEENPLSRGLHMRFHGPIYRKKSGLLQVCPIGWWTAKDVWAYIVDNGLPYHPIYDKTMFETREEIRQSNWAGGFVDWKNGHWSKIRYYYPELWRLIVEEVPTIAQFN